MKIQILALMFVVMGLTACQTAPKSVSRPEAEMPSTPVYETQAPQDVEQDEIIDYVGLQRSLGMERDQGVLGYVEKSFATCQAGYGYSSNRNCRRETLAVVHFQIMCRDSEGTVSTAISHSDLEPLSRRSATWNMMSQKSSIDLDDQGRGQVVMAFKSSPRNQRLRITVGEDFLYLKAGEVKRIVVPKNWCE